MQNINGVLVTNEDETGFVIKTVNANVEFKQSNEVVFKNMGKLVEGRSHHRIKQGNGSSEI